MTDLLHHFWCSLLIVLIQQAHLNYSAYVAEVDLSLTQMSQIMIKLDQFLSSKCKIEPKVEQMIANLKELQISSIRHFFDFDNKNEFIPIILYNLVESLPKLGKGIKQSAANSPNFDLNTELAQLTLEQNLLMLEGLFDFGWYNGSKLVYDPKHKELLKTKAGAKWRLIDWHFYEKLEKKFWEVRDIIRHILSIDMQSTLFQNWNPTQIKVKFCWFAHYEDIEKWMICKSHQKSESSSSSSSLKNGEIVQNNGKRQKKEQN